MSDNDVKLLKDIEQSRKSEREFKERQEKNSEFEKASQGAYFALFNSVTGAVTAVVSVIVIETLLWKSSRTLFIVVTVLLIISMLFRAISKHYFLKGKQKQFERFNKLSKATGVVSSVADATVLKGSKATSSTDKAEAAQSKVTGAIETLTEMQFNGGVYIDPKYDAVRERCKRMGEYVYTTQSPTYMENLLSSIYKETVGGVLSKTASVTAKLFTMYAKDYMHGGYKYADKDLFFYVLGALQFYRTPQRELSNTVPVLGYKDNLFSIYCVYAAYRDDIDEYADWKLGQMREQVIKRRLKDIDSLWDFLCSQGAAANTYIDDLLEKFDEEIKKCEVHKENKDIVHTLRDIVNYWDQDLYTEISREELVGIIGFLCYVATDRKEKNGGLSDEDGYLDVDIYAACCAVKCSNTIKHFKEWEALYGMYRENDPLIEYLNIAVGDSEEAREAEIKRLSKLCKDKTITNELDRARNVLSKQFDMHERFVVLPDSMHEWAQSKGLSDEEAIERIYKYIPETFKKDDVDNVNLVIRYWNRYSDILTE